MSSTTTRLARSAGEIGAGAVFHLASAEPRDEILALLRMLRPHRLEQVRKVRVGRAFDGGYVMLDRFAGVEAAYSLGISDDVSWDLDIAQRGIRVFQFDHTIDALPRTHPLFAWRRLGVSDGARSRGVLKTIGALLKANGHAGSRNLILKCDIEGAEWGALRHVSPGVLGGFRQIVLELHGLHLIGAEPCREVMRQALSNLLESHVVVHVHGNNHGGWAILSGAPLPVTLEVTLARADEGRFVASDETFPTALDRPCNPRDADYRLGRFEFS